MTRIKKITVLLLMLATVALPLPALADSSGQIFGACDQAPNSPVCQSKNVNQDPALHIINVAANIVALLAGIAAVILIIISGLTMITSGGNQEAVANSRKRIVAAMIGLVVIAMAWTITRFVTDKIIG